MALYQINSRKIQQDGDTKLIWYYGPDAEVRLSLLENEIARLEIFWEDHYLQAHEQTIKYGKVLSEERDTAFRSKTADLIVLDSDINLSLFLSLLKQARKFILLCVGLDEQLKTMLLAYLDHRGSRPELLKSEVPLNAYRDYASSALRNNLKVKIRKFRNLSPYMKATGLIFIFLSLLFGLWLYRLSFYEKAETQGLVSQEDYQVQRWQRLCDEGESLACIRFKLAKKNESDSSASSASEIRETQCAEGDSKTCLNLARESLRSSDLEAQKQGIEFLRTACQGQNAQGCALLEERESYLELKRFCVNGQEDRCLAAGGLAEKFRLYSQARKLYKKGCELKIEGNCLALGLQYIKENDTSSGLKFLRASCVNGEKRGCFELRVFQEEDPREARQRLSIEAHKCQRGENKACVVFSIPE